ncbi:WAT1-related protein At2g39510-like isoform X2 [Malus domestica]|uniref:WAT1-related protein At2g39510-like isoform X2 n=1 Tax=Malus domestica TaxID=3750 RepID=UPI003974D98D
MAVILLQCGDAGQNVIARLALNQGMSHYVFFVYRMAIATVLISPFALILDRKSRPKMTFSILAKTMPLSLFELEKVNIRKLHSQAKVAGTTVTVGGAIILTLVKGPELNFPWTKGKGLNYDHHLLQSDSNPKDLIKSALVTAASCFFWSCFIILQAFTLRSYPCELSLTAFTCFWGLVEAAVLALFMEQENPNPVWSTQFDIKLLASFYGAILSGVNYYIMGMVNKEKDLFTILLLTP